MYPLAHVITSCGNKIVVCTVLGGNADVWWDEAVAVVSLPAWAVRGPGLLGTVKSKPPLPLDIAIVSQIKSCISGMELKVFFIKIHLTSKIQYMFYLNSVDTHVSQLFWPVFPLKLMTCYYSPRSTILVGI